MIDTLLEKKLKDLKEDKILVVMSDGIAFKGKLEDFDKKTLVISEVRQGPTKDIIWTDTEEGKEGEEPMRVKEGDEPKQDRYGYIPWTSINLEEVYLRTDHITRIWPWKKVKSGTEMTGTPKEEAPAYVKNPSETNVSASLDLQ